MLPPPRPRSCAPCCSARSATAARELALKRSGYGEPVEVAIAHDGDRLLAATPARRRAARRPAGGRRARVAARRGRGRCAASSSPPGARRGRSVTAATSTASSSSRCRRGRLLDPELVRARIRGAGGGIDRLRAVAYALPGAAARRSVPRRRRSARTIRCASPRRSRGSTGDRPTRARSRSTRRPSCALLGDGGGRRSPRTTTRIPPAASRAGSCSGSTGWASGAATTRTSRTSRAASRATTARSRRRSGRRCSPTGLLAEKPSVGQRHVFLNPRRAGDIHRLIETGAAPPGLKLP